MFSVRLGVLAGAVLLGLSSVCGAVSLPDLNASVPTGTFSCSLAKNPAHLPENSQAKIQLKTLVIQQYMNVLWKQSRVYLWLGADTADGTVNYEGFPGILQRISKTGASILTLDVSDGIKVNLSGGIFQVNLADGTSYRCQ